MRQDSSSKMMSNLKKRYQLSFRRWLVAQSGGGTVAEYVGGNLEEVRAWVTSKMLPEMTWSNYGTVWVLDHIAPLRLFDLTNKDDLKIALHYKNVMPLFKEDNLYKEGAIDFSIKVLDSMPPCETVLKLKEALLKEASRLNKYLPMPLAISA